MFKILGVLLALYTLAAVVRGEVFAKSGVWGRTVSRAQAPEYFWIVIGIYTALSISLILVF
jgi:hypothetical protein